MDDYHRYDRIERKNLPFTPLHPECNYMDIMEQHLQLLAIGHPILKPVYNHHDGTLGRPVLVEPREYVIIEGLLPLHSKLTRACFDATVYLDPPEPVRYDWKIKRDTTKRGYTEEARSSPTCDAASPSRRSSSGPSGRQADIVVRFARIEGRDENETGLLSATVLLRPDRSPPGPGQHPDRRHPRGHPPQADPRRGRQAGRRPPHPRLCPPGDHQRGRGGDLGGAGHRRGAARVASAPSRRQRSEPLAIAQLILLYHLLAGAPGRREPAGHDVSNQRQPEETARLVDDGRRRKGRV